MGRINVGGRELNLLFDIPAWEELEKNVCTLKELLTGMREKKYDRLSCESAAETLKIAAILAHSGGTDADYDWLRAHCTPGQTIALRLAVLEAINDGMEFENKPEGPRDLVLEELNAQKKTET